MGAGFLKELLPFYRHQLSMPQVLELFHGNKMIMPLRAYSSYQEAPD